MANATLAGLQPSPGTSLAILASGTNPDGTTFALPVTQNAGGTLIIVGNQTPADAVANPTDAVDTRTFLELWNGATWDRNRSSSAANMSASTSGMGGQISTAPGMWAVQSNPAAGTAASASRAAGGAGVRHVCTSVYVAISATTAIAAGTLTFNLRDGATGAGTVLMSWQVIEAAATVPFTVVVQLSGLAVFGSAATAMTLEGSASVANLVSSINLTGYDVV